MLYLLLALAVAGDGPAAGHWRAALGPADSEVPFDLVLARTGETLVATIQNGAEVPEVAWNEPELVLGFPHYDARIVARLAPDARTLAGEWTRKSSGDQWTRLAFRAEAGPRPRFAALGQARPEPVPARCEWKLELGTGESTGVLLLEPQAGTEVHATVLTPTGDFRYLAGTLEGERLRLSCFDGSHAFLFDGRRAAGSTTWTGACRLGAATGTWSATPRAERELPDPQEFAATPPEARFPLALLSYSDLDGVQRALAEPLLEGRPMVIELSGSWCPNCQDEMSLLARLERRFGPRGVDFTALLFEHGGDFARDARQARRMAERHGARYRMLLAGPSTRAGASAAFPVLPAITAFPTLLFVRRDGSLAALHTGFSGPATGERHAALERRLEAELEALVASPAPDSEATWKLLLSQPWRDEREGLFITFRREGAKGGFEALELTRWDRPTREGVVASGEVQVAGTLVRLGPALWSLDRHTAELIDPFDYAHRMLGAVRPHLPLFEGQAIDRPEDLATALTSGDPRRRAATRYHLVRALQNQELEPRFEPWRGIDDEDPLAACLAVWAAGELQQAGLAAPLAKLLEHPFAPLRREALRALGRLGWDRTRPELQALAQRDIDALVRALAADPPAPPPPPPDFGQGAGGDDEPR